MNVDSVMALAESARTQLRCTRTDGGRYGAEMRGMRHPLSCGISSWDMPRSRRQVGPRLEKDKIRAWWGDLYRQLYAARNDRLDGPRPELMVRDFENFMCRRRLVAAVEMAESPNLDVLEIGPCGGGYSSIFKLKGARTSAVTDLEQALGPPLGFSWNIVARKSARS